MACVTLKRPLDHFSEPLLSPGGHHPGHHHHQQPPTKRRRCIPVRHNRPGSNRSYDDSLEDALAVTSPSSTSSGHHNGNNGSASGSSAVFKETSLSPAQIASNLRDELKRLRRRKQLVPASPQSHHHHPYASPPRQSTSAVRSSPPSSPEPMMDDASAVRAATNLLSSSQQQQVQQPQSPSSSAVLARSENKPLFTLKQMTLICERMCKERTDQVREEYDKILNQKLSEQYESFVRFIDQQIQRRFSEAQAPSYLS